jgi:TDG/mug DNA glycosylase family protein
VGITNLVTRPDGVGDLEETVQELQPQLVAILGLTAYRTAFDHPGAGLGLQAKRLGGRPVWVLPNPCGDDVHHRREDFVRFYAAARERAEQEVEQPRFPSTERVGDAERAALSNGHQDMADR